MNKSEKTIKPIKEEISLDELEKTVEKNNVIDKLFDEIIGVAKTFNSSINTELIKKAFLISKKYHGEQFRISGEPFVIHPLEVAKIIASIRCV